MNLFVPLWLKTPTGLWFSFIRMKMIPVLSICFICFFCVLALTKSDLYIIPIRLMYWLCDFFCQSWSWPCIYAL